MHMCSRCLFESFPKRDNPRMSPTPVIRRAQFDLTALPAAYRTFCAFVLLGGVFLVRMELPCVVLWRPEALDCRVLIPPETWS